MSAIRPKYAAESLLGAADEVAWSVQWSTRRNRCQAEWQDWHGKHTWAPPYQAKEARRQQEELAAAAKPSAAEEAAAELKAEASAAFDAQNYEEAEQKYADALHVAQQAEEPRCRATGGPSRAAPVWETPLGATDWRWTGQQEEVTVEMQHCPPPESSAAVVRAARAAAAQIRAATGAEPTATPKKNEEKAAADREPSRPSDSFQEEEEAAELGRDDATALLQALSRDGDPALAAAGAKSLRAFGAASKVVLMAGRGTKQAHAVSAGAMLRSAGGQVQEHARASKKHGLGAMSIADAASAAAASGAAEAREEVTRPTAVRAHVH